MSLRKPKDEGERWISASLVSFGIFVVLIVTMAIIPSFWLYFADGTLQWTGQLLQIVRDIIVSGYYVVALVVLGAGVLIYQKRNPKVLISGEDKREATGGYK